MTKGLELKKQHSFYLRPFWSAIFNPQFVFLGDSDDTVTHMCLKQKVDDDIFKEVLRHKPDLNLKNRDGKKPTEIKSEFAPLNEILQQYIRN